MGFKPETLVKYKKVKKLSLRMSIDEACAMVGMSPDSYYKVINILSMQERYKHITGMGIPVAVGEQNEETN